MVKGLPFPTGVGWQSSPGSSLHFRKHIQKVQAAFATGGNPKARVWRRNAMQTVRIRLSCKKSSLHIRIPQMQAAFSIGKRCVSEVRKA